MITQIIFMVIAFDLGGIWLTLFILTQLIFAGYWIFNNLQLIKYIRDAILSQIIGKDYDKYLVRKLKQKNKNK